MNSIEAYLNKCSREYYAGVPSISDAVFDALAESIGYNKVGAKQHEHIEKHMFPMYSLQKFYEDEDKKRPLAEYNDADKVRSPKIDGAAVSLLYIDGQLVRALTRGDGIEGTIVTEKFLSTNLVPKFISNIGVVQITGEIAAPKHVENARNYAAGSLTLKDINEFKTRAVTFFAYGIQPQEYDTYRQDLEFLRHQGFNTILDENIHLIYPCDGIVYRLNSNTEFYSLGYTAKHPNGAYALKERGEAVETTLLDVVWQTGKSGKVTPVAILEPCKIGDSTVSRATLNNIAFIRALDLRKGDRVGVIKGGDIIPCITHKIE